MCQTVSKSVSDPAKFRVSILGFSVSGPGSRVCRTVSKSVSDPAKFRVSGSASASERRGNNLKGCKENFCLNGSSQCQNIALTIVCVPNSLDSGPAVSAARVLQENR